MYQIQTESLNNFGMLPTFFAAKAEITEKGVAMKSEFSSFKEAFVYTYVARYICAHTCICL